MRLDHLLVSLGTGSRRDVQKWIRAGRVQVNGQVQKDPGVHLSEQQEIVLDGQRLDTRLERHVMLNKPTGVLTAARDPKQKTVMDLLPGVYRALQCMPCGRLDKDTEGLLIFTTDGELSHRLLSPARHVDKCYEARVEGILCEKDRDLFASGMDLGDFTAAPAVLTILQTASSESVAQVIIHEGKFHQVRRMFEYTGHPVIELRRLSFGPVALDPELAPGAFRELTREEENRLYAAAGLDHGTDVF